MRTLEDPNTDTRPNQKGIIHQSVVSNPSSGSLVRGDADGGKSPRATCRVSALLRFERNPTRDLNLSSTYQPQAYINCTSEASASNAANRSMTKGLRLRAAASRAGTLLATCASHAQ